MISIFVVCRDYIPAGNCYKDCSVVAANRGCYDIFGWGCPVAGSFREHCRISCDNCEGNVDLF